MLKEFLVPDLRKMIIYLLFVTIFMSEILLIRYVYHKDNIVTFLSGFYENFSGAESYISLFTISFFFYIFILIIIYLLSCFVSLIIDKIKKK
jgi:hypothetical protein